MSSDLVVFDLDYTLINADCSTLWCEYMYKHNLTCGEAFLKQEQELMKLYDQGTMDVHDYIAFSMQPLLTVPIDKVQALIHDYVSNILVPTIFPQALKLIDYYKSIGTDMLIISASASFIVKEIAKHLKIDNVIGIDVVQKNGFYINKIEGIPSYKEGKVFKLEQFIQAHKQYTGKISFYTDSINDLSLLQKADIAYVVNPNASLQEIAKVNGYEILNWSN